MLVLRGQPPRNRCSAICGCEEARGGRQGGQRAHGDRPAGDVTRCSAAAGRHLWKRGTQSQARLVVDIFTNCGRAVADAHQLHHQMVGPEQEHTVPAQGSEGAGRLRVARPLRGCLGPKQPAASSFLPPSPGDAPRDGVLAEEAAAHEGRAARGGQHCDRGPDGCSVRQRPAREERPAGTVAEREDGGEDGDAGWKGGGWREGSREGAGRPRFRWQQQAGAAASARPRGCRRSQRRALHLLTSHVRQPVHRWR